jgi:hypothetical protein
VLGGMDSPGISTVRRDYGPRRDSVQLGGYNPRRGEVPMGTTWWRRSLLVERSLPEGRGHPEVCYQAQLRSLYWDKAPFCDEDPGGTRTSGYGSYDVLRTVSTPGEIQRLLYSQSVLEMGRYMPVYYTGTSFCS